MTPQMLLGVFQSIGDTCEFAAFQEREAGRRQVTLLSHANCPLPELEAALACRFAGVGEAANTRLEWRAEMGEYRLVAAPFFRMHSSRFEQLDAAGLAEAERDAAVMLRLQVRRLLADLADPKRIFVFASAAADFDTAAARRLHAALRQVSPAGLLCVGVAPWPDWVGQVVAQGDGLMLGWLDRFGQFPAGRPWVGSAEVWRRLCAGALGLHQAG